VSSIADANQISLAVRIDKVINSFQQIQILFGDGAHPRTAIKATLPQCAWTTLDADR
jgi:hypothetical protein